MRAGALAIDAMAGVAAAVIAIAAAARIGRTRIIYLASTGKIGWRCCSAIPALSRAELLKRSDWNLYQAAEAHAVAASFSSPSALVSRAFLRAIALQNRARRRAR